MARLTVYQDEGREWRWRLRASNGEIVATSGESFTRKHDAERAAGGAFPNHQIKPVDLPSSSPAPDTADEPEGGGSNVKVYGRREAAPDPEGVTPKKRVRRKKDEG